MKQKALFVIFEGVLLKQIKSTFLEGESPTLNVYRRDETQKPQKIQIARDFCYHKLITMKVEEINIKESGLYKTKLPFSEMLYLYNPRLYLLQES